MALFSSPLSKKWNEGYKVLLNKKKDGVPSVFIYCFTVTQANPAVSQNDIIPTEQSWWVMCLRKGLLTEYVCYAHGDKYIQFLSFKLIIWTGIKSRQNNYTTKIIFTKRI